MLATRIQYAFVGTALLLAINGFAQQGPVDRAAAQQRYDAEVAACNRGNLPADGRATVVAPVGSVTPPAASDTVTTQDGRATIVLPADRAGAPR
jgi:hypothetical protein